MDERQMMRFGIGFVIGVVMFRPLAVCLAYKLDSWWWDRKCRIRNEKYEAKYGKTDFAKQSREGLEREMAEGSGCWAYISEM